MELEHRQFTLAVPSAPFLFLPLTGVLKEEWRGAIEQVLGRGAEGQSEPWTGPPFEDLPHAFIKRLKPPQATVPAAARALGTNLTLDSQLNHTAVLPPEQS